MRRVAYGLIFAVLVSIASAGTADAGFEWCSEDPTFVVNGNVIDINTTFLAKYASSVKVPVVVEVTKSLPRWWGLLNMPVVARVTVKASASFDTYTRVIGTGLWLTTVVQGKSNTTTSTKFYLL